MLPTWLVLLPPVIVVGLAAITRKTIMSLLVGIFLALLIVTNFSLPEAVLQMGLRLWKTTELASVTSCNALLATSNLLICLFLLILGILMTMIRYSGGAYAYGTRVMKYLRSARSAESASLLLSLFFFIDDYFSCLTVGSVMQTVTDRFKVPRAKLGLLVNSMAASLAVIVPVSSWVAEIMVQLRNSGMAASAAGGALIVGDAFYCYLQTIPYIFYSFITIVSLWILVSRRISFGILRKHEQVAERTGNMFAGKIPVTRRLKEISQEAITGSSIIDFCFPIGFLFLSVFVGVLYFGGYSLFGGPHSFVEALQKTQIASALFVGALLTLLLSTVFFLSRGKVELRQLPSMWYEGIDLMLQSVLILLLIWTLSSLLRNDLHTGEYLAQLLVGKIQVGLLPVAFFLVSVLTSTMMGSAWGTIGIYIPIALPMLVSLMGLPLPVAASACPVLFPLVGGIIAGAIVGNHLSPISDTMLMASTSSGSYHIDLVRAQMSFTLPTVVSTALAFVVAGVLLPLGLRTWLVAPLSITAGILWNTIQFFVLHIVWKKKIF